jgi:hypothetical protein
MSTTKHTPGPWVASCRHIGYEGGDWPEDEFLQWEVDGPRVPWGRGEFFQADARLIAAAPELLEALKTARAFMSIASDWNIDEAEIDGQMRSTYDWIEVVDAAIAKATGETK